MAAILPKWTNSVLQGITYWLGYQNSFFRHYHIPEAAIVHEVCKLISAHNEERLFIFLEVSYAKLGVRLKKKSGEEHRGLADLVLAGTKLTDSCPDPSSVKFVIEVKRYNVNPAHINSDLTPLIEPVLA